MFPFCVVFINGRKKRKRGAAQLGKINKKFLLTAGFKWHKLLNMFSIISEKQTNYCVSINEIKVLLNATLFYSYISYMWFVFKCF